MTNASAGMHGPPRPDGRYTGGYTSNEVDYQYDEGYDALLGAQMHLPRFKNSPYGPWEMASAAVLYPSPFDETTYGNWPSRHTPGSTNSMDHFIAYVKGATGSVKTGMKTDDSLGADLTGPWHLFVDDDELLNRSSSVVRKYSQMDKFSGTLLRPNMYRCLLHHFFALSLLASSLVFALMLCTFPIERLVCGSR